jgi:polynucleotide 5'-kinase involved in rRNA processing
VTWISLDDDRGTAGSAERTTGYYGNCMTTITNHWGRLDRLRPALRPLGWPDMCLEWDVADRGKRREGRFILVVGPDGSGKSTLAGILLRSGQGTCASVPP